MNVGVGMYKTHLWMWAFALISLAAVAADPAAQTPEAKQALAVAKAEFRKHFASCGGNEVTRIKLFDSDDEILQLKQVGFRLARVYPLTAADKANGITWSGVVEFRYTTGRYYGSGAWDVWLEPREIWLGSRDVNVTRRQGVWKAQMDLSHGSGQESKYEALACADIPPG
jgi:hypothetical protein